MIVLCLLEKLYFFLNVRNKYYIYSARLTSELESGKSSGPDDISPESLKFANNQLSILLSLCFLCVFLIVTCHLTRLKLPLFLL